MVTVSETGPSRRQEPGIASGSPMWEVGTQALEPHSTAFPDMLATAELEVEQTRLNWEAADAGGYLTLGSTTAATPDPQIICEAEGEEEHRRGGWGGENQREWKNLSR